jgi:hypothetical protein
MSTLPSAIVAAGKSSSKSPKGLEFPKSLHRCTNRSQPLRLVIFVPHNELRIGISRITLRTLAKQVADRKFKLRFPWVR